MIKNIGKLLFFIIIAGGIFFLCNNNIKASTNITKSMFESNNKYNSGTDTSFHLNSNITIKKNESVQNANGYLLNFNATTNKSINIDGKGHTIKFQQHDDGSYPTAKRFLKVHNNTSNDNKKLLKVYISNIKFVNFKVRRTGAVIKAGGALICFKDCYFENCYCKNPLDDGDEDDETDAGGGAVASYAKETQFWGCEFKNCFLWNQDGSTKEMKGGAVKIRGNIARFGAVTGDYFNKTAHYCKFTNCRTMPTWDNYLYTGDTRWTDDNGGALHINNATTYISGGTFEKCRAGDAGGAIHCVSSKTWDNVPTLCIGYGGGQTIFKNNECATSVKSFDTTWEGGGAINTLNFDLDIGKIRPTAAYNNGYNVIDSWNSRENMVNSNGQPNVTFESNKSYTAGGALYLCATSGGYAKSRIVANFYKNESATGGAVLAQGSEVSTSATYLLFNRCKFTDNTTWDLAGQSRNNNGGALYSLQKTYIDTCKFDNNDAQQDNGGAMVLSQRNSSNCSNEGYIQATEIKNCDAAGSGGAIFDDFKSGLSVWGCNRIHDNKATNGGGIYTTTNGSTTLGWNSIYENNASNNGGGIYNAGILASSRPGGENGLINNTNVNTTNPGQIGFNTAGNNGGGVYNNNNAYFYYYAGTIRNNTATNGGGICNNGNMRSSCRASDDNDPTNHPVIYNTAANGGGIYNGSSGTVTLNLANPNNAPSGCLTVANNTATSSNNDAGCGIKNLGKFNASDYIKNVLYCNNNISSNNKEVQAEFYNTSTGQANFIGGTTPDGSTILGDSNNDNNKLYALNNAGTVNITPNGNYNSEGFTIKSNATTAIYNSGTLNVTGGTKNSYIDVYGDSANGITNAGTLNCTNNASNLVIRGKVDNVKYGIYNTSIKTNNVIKAYIGTKNNPFKCGIYNGVENQNTNSQISSYSGIIQHCTNHGIHNKGTINNINSSTIQNNGSDNVNGGGLLADDNSNTTFKEGNTLKENKAQNGGGIYASSNSNVNLGNKDVEKNKTTKTVSNYLYENTAKELTGKGNNIYIGSNATISDYSTYHKLKDDNGMGSVYIIGANDNQVANRGIYKIGCNVYYENEENGQTNYQPAFIYLNKGTYIDIPETLSNKIKINNVEKDVKIYVLTNDKTREGKINPHDPDSLHNINSQTGRIIANFKNNNQKTLFKHIITNTGLTQYSNRQAKEIESSSYLNSTGKNNIFTNSSCGYNGNDYANSNSNFDYNNSSTLYCNNENKNNQLFLTENYDIEYIGATINKAQQLSQEQLNSISGFSTSNATEGVETITYNNDNSTKSIKKVIIKKYWNEDISIQYFNLTSSFGKFDTTNSWVDSSNQHYPRGMQYTENHSIKLYGIWSDSTQMIVSHYLMNQDGQYDCDSVYSRFSKFATLDNGNWAGGLFGIPEYQDSQWPYKPIEVMSSHEGFESWHQIATIEATQALNENYIKNNLLDQNLIKDNISKYSYCEITTQNDTQSSSIPTVKIFYAREKYTATVEADSGYNEVSIVNPYKYNVTYNAGEHMPTVSRTLTQFTTESNYRPVWGVYDFDSIYSKFSLKKDLTYEFELTFSSMPQSTAGNIVLYDSNDNPLGTWQVEESTKKVNFTFTPEKGGAYYLTGGYSRAQQAEMPIPSFTGTIYIYNTDLQKNITQSQNTRPSSLDKQILHYYAVDESETRDLSYIGLEGVIYEGTGPEWYNRFDGIYKKNNDGTYSRLNSGAFVKDNYSKTGIRASDSLPQYGNVEYKILSTANKYNLNINQILENQKGTGPQHFSTTTITTHGLIKVGDLKELIDSNINDSARSQYINKDKTSGALFNGIPGSSTTSTITKLDEINNLSNDVYLLANRRDYLALQLTFFRKTFTIRTIPGTNASSAIISTDNWAQQSHTQSSITERYFLPENNPFNLPAEEYDTIYLDGQIKEGCSAAWDCLSEVPYNNTYSDSLKNRNTQILILGNQDATFILNAYIMRNITINHYLQNTNGRYQLQEDKTQYIENSSLTSLKPSSYKDSSLEYEVNNVKYKYLDYATYLGDTYNDVTNPITFVANDKDVQINLFYSRKVIPIYIYANKFIEEIGAESNTLRNNKDGEYKLKYDQIEDENARNDGKKLDKIDAYFEEKITFNVETLPSPDNYSITFEGWDNGAYTFDSEHLDCATKEYVYTVEAVPTKHISAWGKLDPNKWHIRYHKNYKDDEDVCGHDEDVDNKSKQHMIYNTSPSMTEGFTSWNQTDDILCVDSDGHEIKTTTVKGEVFDGGSSYKLSKWHTKDGDEFNFGDTISRYNSEGEPASYYDTSTRTIDLYAKWKYKGPKINIYTEDVYIEVGNEITPDKILDKIHVSDGHGHILSNEESNLGIVKIEVERENENQFKYPDGLDLISDTNLNEDDIGNYITSDNAKTYLITVRASAEIDGEDVETTKTYKVIIYENILSKLYIRAIDKDMLPSLPINSIWREQRNYARLIKTLNKGRGNFEKSKKEAKYIYAFNASDLAEIRQKIKENGYKYKPVIKDKYIKKKPEEEQD